VKLPQADLRSIIRRDVNLMERIKIDRINELAMLSKERPLTEEERAEQKQLRDEYIAEVRRALRPDKAEPKA